MESELIQNKIYIIRGKRVMLDFDLAQMYEVETKRLKERVRHNIERFPSDFMFELTKQEWEILRTKFSSSSWGGHRYLPFAFTEQGVAMLSSVLKSKLAIEINISIMRAFVHTRELITGYTELKQQLDNFMMDTNIQFNEVYQALSELSVQKEQEKPRKPIGYQHYK